MNKDNETRNRLLQSAREEFLEKGYMKASLRNICKNAGVTTGALYFFFQDKADLFEALTKDTITGIYQVMHAHYQEERQMAEEGLLATKPATAFEDDFRTVELLIHTMYLHRDDLLLVLTKSQGSSMESVVDKFVEESEEHYRAMADEMQKAYPEVRIDDHFIHWMAHMQIDAFIYAITHIEKEEEAVEFMSRSASFMLMGWYGMFEKGN